MDPEVRLKPDPTRILADPTMMLVRPQGPPWGGPTAAARSRCGPADAVPVQSFGDIDGIHDTNDRRIDGCALSSKRLPCGTPFDDDQHLLVNTGTNGIDCQQRHAAWLIVERHWLDEQQLGTFELAVLVRRDNGADHAGKLHVTRPVARAVSRLRQSLGRGSP